jgi:hypothetical protein
MPFLLFPFSGKHVIPAIFFFPPNVGESRALPPKKMCKSQKVIPCFFPDFFSGAKTRA